MKHIITVLLAMLFSQPINAADIGQVQAQIDILLQIRNELQKSINLIDSKLDSLKSLAGIPTDSTQQVSLQDNNTVYVTKSGKKYHRADCRSLSKSRIPIALNDVGTRYTPCTICSPPVVEAKEKNQEAEQIKPASEITSPSSGQCQATTKKGTRCKRSASPGSKYCWQHGG